jgi:NADPH:quinone reductase-like Zn-dependent oxidoreductase
MASETSMRAVRFHEYGPPSTLVVEAVDRPQPQAGEVLARVHFAGVNPIDWKLRSGNMQRYMPIPLPATPGLDFSGTVDTLGDGVTGFAAGDRAFGRGASTYAEFAVAPIATIAKIPDGVSFEQAATLHVGGVTAWLALFDSAHLEAGQRVLVQGGAGGVGSLAVQLAHWKGASVIATASTANVDYVRSIGADEVIDYTTANVEDAVHDVDVVIDTVGGEVAARSLSLLKPGGILVTVAGMADAEAAAARGVRAEGVARSTETRPILEELAKLVASGDLKPEIQHVFRLDEAAAAQAASETGHGRGRILLEVAD